MRGLKAAANSCTTSPTRRLTVEVDLNEMATTFRKFFENVVEMTEEQARLLWQSYWPVVKGLPSYTTRINGRVMIKRQHIINKRVRAKVAKMRAAK